MTIPIDNRRLAPRRTRKHRHRGAALLLAVFVMTLASTLVVSMLDAEMIRYMALRNTYQWDEARYLAEAGLNDAFARLEKDFSWRAGIRPTEFPAGSGFTYQVTVAEVADGTLNLTAVGTAGTFNRTLQVNVKQGG